jgi:hypothetical protein
MSEYAETIERIARDVMRPPIPTCGTCRWHFALDGRYERIGAGNCMALRWPEVRAIVTTRDAECGWPERFAALAPADSRAEP